MTMPNSVPHLQDTSERFTGFQNVPRKHGLIAPLFLQTNPEAKLTEGVSIDDYSTWRAVRFADPDEIG